MLSRQTEKNLQILEALANSIHEVRLRVEARNMGCSFVTRAKIEDPVFTPSNQKPWSPLPKKYRRRFERYLKTIRPKSQPLSSDERKQLALLLGFTTR